MILDRGDIVQCVNVDPSARAMLEEMGYDEGREGLYRFCYDAEEVLGMCRREKTGGSALILIAGQLNVTPNGRSACRESTIVRA